AIGRTLHAAAVIVGVGERGNDQRVRKRLLPGGAERDILNEPVRIAQRRVRADDRRACALQQAPRLDEAFVAAYALFHSNAKPSDVQRMKQPSPGTKCVGNSSVPLSATDSSNLRRERTPSAGSSSRLVPQCG